MNHQILKGLALLILSSLSYYVPIYFAGLPGYDLSKVPTDFYKFYCWVTSSNLFLVSAYSFYLFIFTDSKFYKIKIIFFWLFLAESYTFINYTISKFWMLEIYDGVEIIGTCIVLIIGFSFVLSRAMSVRESDKFNPEKTYIVKYKPKNWYGILNYIWKIAGHGALYQDGKIYKFRKKSKRVEPVNKTDFQINKLIKSGSMTIHETPRRENINDLIGRKYSLLKFNCNHLTKDA